MRSICIQLGHKRAGATTVTFEFAIVLKDAGGYRKVLRCCGAGDICVAARVHGNASHCLFTRTSKKSSIDQSGSIGTQLRHPGIRPAAKGLLERACSWLERVFAKSISIGASRDINVVRSIECQRNIVKEN